MNNPSSYLSVDDIVSHFKQLIVSRKGQVVLALTGVVGFVLGLLLVAFGIYLVIALLVAVVAIILVRYQKQRNSTNSAPLPSTDLVSLDQHEQVAYDFLRANDPRAATVLSALGEESQIRVLSNLNAGADASEGDKVSASSSDLASHAYPDLPLLPSGDNIASIYERFMASRHRTTILVVGSIAIILLVVSMVRSCESDDASSDEMSTMSDLLNNIDDLETVDSSREVPMSATIVPRGGVLYRNSLMSSGLSYIVTIPTGGSSLIAELNQTTNRSSSSPTNILDMELHRVGKCQDIERVCEGTYMDTDFMRYDGFLEAGAYEIRVYGCGFISCNFELYIDY